MRKIWMLSAVAAMVTTDASAYIDPGAGSLILQLVLGGLAGLALTLKLYWRKLFGRLPREDAVTPIDDDHNTTSG